MVIFLCIIGIKFENSHEDDEGIKALDREKHCEHSNEKTNQNDNGCLKSLLHTVSCHKFKKDSNLQEIEEIEMNIVNEELNQEHEEFIMQPQIDQVHNFINSPINFSLL